MNKLVNTIISAFADGKTEKERLDNFLSTLCVPKLLEDIEINIVKLFLPTILLLVERGFTAQSKDVALGGLGTFIKNIETNEKINRLLKEGKISTDRSPIICMGIHINPAAHDFLLANLENMVEHGYSTVLVEHTEGSFEKAINFRRVFERRSQLRAKIIRHGLAQEGEFIKVQRLLRAAYKNINHFISNTLYKEQGSSKCNIDDNIESQEGYMLLHKDLKLWEGVSTEPGLHLQYAEHYPDTVPCDIKLKSTRNPFIMRLRDIGFALEIGLANLTSPSVCGIEEECLGGGSLLLVGAAHSVGIMKSYASIFPEMPQPYMIYPCLLSPSYNHSMIYSETLDIHRRYVDLAERRVPSELEGRYYRLDLSSPDAYAASSNIFNALLINDIDTAYTLKEFLKIPPEHSRSSIRGPLSFQVSTYVEGKPVYRGLMDVFTVSNARRLIMSGARVLLVSCNMASPQQVKMATLKLSYRDGSSFTEQHLNMSMFVHSYTRVTSSIPRGICANVQEQAKVLAGQSQSSIVPYSLASARSSKLRLKSSQ